MRLIDADKLYPDRMTKDGLAISQSQIANAPTVKAYTEEEVQEIREEVVKQFIDISLCNTCVYSSTCERSDKDISSANHSFCWVYKDKGAYC